MINASLALMPSSRLCKAVYVACAALLVTCVFGCGKQRSSFKQASPSVPSVRTVPAVQESPSVAHLIDTLNKGDLVAKYNALLELGELKDDAKPAIPTLIKILEDDKSPIPGADAAVKQGFIARPEDANAYLRATVAATLGLLGPVAEPAIPTLLSTLKAEDRTLRWTSIMTLGLIGMKDSKVLSALKETLRDPDRGLRIQAASALWALDAENQDAASTVSQLLKDEDPLTRRLAASTLRWPSSPRIKHRIPALVAALKDPDEEVRAIAAQSLAHIHEEPKVVVPALIERLEKDKASSVRVQAAKALGEFGPEAKSAIIALTRATNEDPNSGVQEAAAQAIKLIKELPAGL